MECVSWCACRQAGSKLLNHQIFRGMLRGELAELDLSGLVSARWGPTAQRHYIAVLRMVLWHGQYGTQGLAEWG